MHISTITGKFIDLSKFNAEDIDVRDIGMSLARQRRYAGHTLENWSVGQHLIYCGFIGTSLGLEKDVVNACFLHDVEETWVQDIVQPIKSTYMLRKYSKMCKSVSDVVYEYFGVERHHKIVKDIDMIACVMEKKRLMPHVDWGNHGPIVDPELTRKLIDNGCIVDDALLNLTEEEVYDILVRNLNVMHSEKQLGGEIVLDD